MAESTNALMFAFECSCNKLKLGGACTLRVSWTTVVITTTHVQRDKKYTLLYSADLVSPKTSPSGVYWMCVKPSVRIFYKVRQVEEIFQKLSLQPKNMCYVKDFLSCSLKVFSSHILYEKSICLSL